jgi:hypothetical protein
MAARQSKPEYLTRLPDKIPEGQVLTHNRVKGNVRTLQLTGSGLTTFRAWLEPAGQDNREPCTCSLTPHVPVHYRVADTARERARASGAA